MHTATGVQHFLRHTPQDGQVRAGNSRVKLHAGNTEDMGAIQTVFRTYHQELRETSDITVEDAGMHHANMVRDVVERLSVALQQHDVPCWHDAYLRLQR